MPSCQGRDLSARSPIGGRPSAGSRGARDAKSVPKRQSRSRTALGCPLGSQRGAPFPWCPIGRGTSRSRLRSLPRAPRAGPTSCSVCSCHPQNRPGHRFPVRSLTGSRPAGWSGRQAQPYIRERSREPGAPNLRRTPSDFEPFVLREPLEGLAQASCPGIDQRIEKFSRAAGIEREQHGLHGADRRRGHR